MTTSEQSCDRDHSSSGSLTAIIENAGDRIYEDIDFKSRSILYKQAEEWGQQHGLYRTNEPERILCRLAAYNRHLTRSFFLSRLVPATHSRSHDPQPLIPGRGQ